MNNSNSGEFLGASEKQVREYQDRHYVSMWRIIDTESALETLRDENNLLSLRKSIWWQRLEEAKKSDNENNTFVITEIEKDKIKEEMKRGWPSFEPGVTDTRMFELAYTGGNGEDLTLVREISWFLRLAIMDTQISLDPDEYLSIIVSRFNINPNQLREIFDTCSKDFKKVVTVLTALDLGKIKIEEINSNMNFEALASNLRANGLPEFRNNFDE